MRWIDNIIAFFRPKRAEPVRAGREPVGVDTRSGERADRAVERLLENESLTADLEDAPARVLLELGADWARRIAGSTAAIRDEAAADQALAPALEGVRQALRLMADFAAAPSSDPAAANALLDTLLAHLPLSITPEQRQKVLSQLTQAASAEQALLALKQLVEQDTKS
jgi:hypothetical protein